MLQCVAVCCSVLQCVAVCCSVLQCVQDVASVMSFEFHVYCSVLQCIVVFAVRCSVLQCVAVCCSVLQCVAVCCSEFRICRPRGVTRHVTYTSHTHQCGESHYFFSHLFDHL